ncbi:MAG: rRNA adenine N-6-methyltransferase family protein, partial [Caldisphaera sp.]|nr:rRNA adenine N-6-methyltransferase family protein [Caldisphaera sp.]
FIYKKYLPKNVELVVSDGLEFVKSNRIPILVSNVPYSMTSNLIINIAKNNNILYSVLGIQKEVADRLISTPGSENYSRLSVIMQLLFSIKSVGIISSRDYFPKPDVDSTVITLTRTKNWDDELEILEKFTSCIFSQKNKKANKIIKACIENMGLRPNYDKVNLSDKRVRELTPKEIITMIKW